MSRRSSVSTADESHVTAESIITSSSHLSSSHLAAPTPSSRISVLGITSAVLGIITGILVFARWPFPTTVPVFIALLSGCLVWTIGSWIQVLRWWLKDGDGAGVDEGYEILPQDLTVGDLGTGVEEKREIVAKGSRRGRSGAMGTKRWIVLGCTTGLLFAVVCVGILPPTRDRLPATTSIPPPSNTPSSASSPSASIPTPPSEPSGHQLTGGGKIFIAANLYNVAGIWDTWSGEVVRLLEFVGTNNTYLSIYESNSSDNTPKLLTSLSTTLTTLGIRHRIISEKTGGRSWPHGASEARIAYLAKARNRALEPLSSEDPEVRLPGGEGWEEGKVVFLNDVVFEAEQVVRLLESRVEGEEEGYDLACGVDFGWSGMYDTWVARDACGTPLRPFWPYVMDPQSIESVRREEVFEVGSCWNGVVAFKAGLVAYQGMPGAGMMNATGVSEVRKRGWQMIDNVLFSYDLHRLYPTKERPPRILMNPKVKVAYEQRWWVWHNVVLEIPVIKLWINHWSRGYPLMVVDWIWESAGRRRDYCTWAGLSPHLPERCPALPGAAQRNWDQG